jgi:hypothetical protein
MAARCHDGELAVQHRAGVAAQAARLAGMLAPPKLDGAMHAFLAACDFAVITGRDHEPWSRSTGAPPSMWARAYDALSVTVSAERVAAAHVEMPAVCRGAPDARGNRIL